MPHDTWLDPAFTDAYANKADPKDWYEREVNTPALLSLLPIERARVLDFGCGTGDLAAALSERYDVEGCDVSPRMIELAQNAHPDIMFRVWDGISPYPEEAALFDAVSAKLVLMFVNDLALLAERVSAILRPGGSFVFSVAHPVSTVRKTGGNYFDTVQYPSEIGASGIRTTMIHRSFEEYIRPFVEKSFVMTGIREPRITAEQAGKYGGEANDTLIPKRLILRFNKSTAENHFQS